MLHIQNTLFQFHKGAIRTNNNFQGELYQASPFQFHKGAIRTPLSTMQLWNLLEFQFHKGAIRTCY